MSSDLLDERLEWPLRASGQRSTLRLGTAFCGIGPGWWPYVRRAFATLAETPGATMLQVKQRCGWLELHPYHPERAQLERLYALATELREASRATCEACGARVPPLPPGQVAWRTHCVACAARLGVLRTEDPLHAELRLWEERAGCAWPRRGR